LTTSLTKFAVGTIPLLILAVGIATKISAQQAALEEERTLASDAEVIVTIAVPEGNTLTGTAIITLEDITVQDAPSLPLASVSTAVSALMDAQATIAIPIDLSLVDSKADVNVAVHIDADDDGVVSNGDWISDSIVNVINNDKMNVVVEVVQIGAQ